MRRDGFSLVELIIVIALIALLLGIMLPALAGARDQGRSIVCQSNLKQSATHTLAYAALHGDRLPQGFSDVGFASCPPPGGYLGQATKDWQGWWWLHFIAQGGNAANQDSLRCPSQTQGNDPVWGHYGANYAVLKIAEGNIQEEFWGLSPKVSGLRQPTRTFLYVDSGYALIGRKAFLPVQQITFENKKRQSSFFLPGLTANADRRIEAIQQNDAVKGRHWKRRVNTAFADGRVEMISANRLADEYPLLPQQ